MRLPFPLKEQPYGAMTPLKQVVAVKRKEEEAPKASAPAVEMKAEVAAEGGAVDEVASKMERISVDAAAAAGKA